ncbi:Protein of unknown function [Cotesia congregata]|uniref:Uncharacterized protein n=1 Tax=Cotesia congregata TaxID=51543 RepID=A0A8J2EMK2_COTCN|nr:Protein of unknown function [Cotesia congregata]
MTNSDLNRLLEFKRLYSFVELNEFRIACFNLVAFRLATSLAFQWMKDYSVVTSGTEVLLAFGIVGHVIVCQNNPTIIKYHHPKQLNSKSVLLNYEIDSDIEKTVKATRRRGVMKIILDPNDGLLVPIGPGPGIEPGSFGYALRARTVKLSETSPATTFQSPNTFLFNTIKKYLLKYSRYNYLSILNKGLIILINYNSEIRKIIRKTRTGDRTWILWVRTKGSDSCAI